jgi:hypothetical protein
MRPPQGDRLHEQRTSKVSSRCREGSKGKWLAHLLIQGSFQEAKRCSSLKEVEESITFSLCSVFSFMMQIFMLRIFHKHKK